jgi:hypothetical protein
VIVQVAELLQHVPQCRFALGDAGDLIIRKRVNISDGVAFGEGIKDRPQPRFDDTPHQVRRWHVELHRFHGAATGHMYGIIEAVLNVAIEAGDEAIPEAALGEDEHAEAVDLMHDLHDPGEERFGDAVDIIGAASEQQIFQLIEGDDDRHLQMPEEFHERLEEGQHQVLPRRADVEFNLGEAIGEEIRQVRFLLEQDGLGEMQADGLAHDAMRVVAVGLGEMSREHFERPLGGKIGFGERLRQRCRDAVQAEMATQAFGEPFGAFGGLSLTDAEPPRPATDPRRREEIDLRIG